MTFRLAHLLRIRAVQQDTAAAAAGVATERAISVRGTSTSRRAALADAGFPTAGGEAAFAAAVAARGAMTARYAESLDLVLQADLEADRARTELAAARARVKALERLEQRHLEGERAAVERAEQAAIDERASRRVIDTTIDTTVEEEVLS